MTKQNVPVQFSTCIRFLCAFIIFKPRQEAIIFNKNKKSPCIHVYKTDLRHFSYITIHQLPQCHLVHLYRPEVTVDDISPARQWHQWHHLHPLTSDKDDVTPDVTPDGWPWNSVTDRVLYKWKSRAPRHSRRCWCISRRRPDHSSCQGKPRVKSAHLNKTWHHLSQHWQHSAVSRLNKTEGDACVIVYRHLTANFVHCIYRVFWFKISVKSSPQSGQLMSDLKFYMIGLSG